MSITTQQKHFGETLKAEDNISSGMLCSTSEALKEVVGKLTDKSSTNGLDAKKKAATFLTKCCSPLFFTKSFTLKTQPLLNQPLQEPGESFSKETKDTNLSYTPYGVLNNPSFILRETQKGDHNGLF